MMTMYTLDEAREIIAAEKRHNELVGRFWDGKHAEVQAAKKRRAMKRKKALRAQRITGGALLIAALASVWACDGFVVCVVLALMGIGMIGTKTQLFYD